MASRLSIVSHHRRCGSGNGHSGRQWTKRTVSSTAARLFSYGFVPFFFWYRQGHRIRKQGRRILSSTGSHAACEYVSDFIDESSTTA